MKKIFIVAVFTCFIAFGQTVYAQDAKKNNDAGVNGSESLMRETPDIIAEGQCGENVFWTLDNAGTLHITGTGDMYDYDYDSAFDTVVGEQYISNVKKLIISEGVTRIGMCAFDDYTNLEKVEMADSVTEVAALAFSDCTALEDIQLSHNITVIDESVFRLCKSLTEISIPEGVTEIGAGAFTGCDSLERVENT